MVSQFVYSFISFSASFAFKNGSILQQSPTNGCYASLSIFILNLTPVPIVSKSIKSRIGANLQSWTRTLCATSIVSFFVTFCHSFHIQIHINLFGLQVQLIFLTVFSPFKYYTSNTKSAIASKQSIASFERRSRSRHYRKCNP